MSERYNGWTNYETWNLALWLGNESGSEDYWRERAEEAYREASGDDRKHDAACVVADALKEETEENAPDLGCSFYSDVLSAAISEVNWYEIAQHYVDDVAGDIDEEEAEEAAEDEDDEEDEGEQL